MLSKDDGMMIEEEEGRKGVTVATRQNCHTMLYHLH